ncbi:hypothetical protein AB0E01_44230 [Nocardia vinacea]|uniref:hypothetical protein n=1 Tax=Nocardia vinacea TaxID=96468 RepID=UPI0033E4037B
MTINARRAIQPVADRTPWDIHGDPVIRDGNPSFEAQVKVEFNWQETETDNGTTLFAGIDGVLYATIMPTITDHSTL